MSRVAIEFDAEIAGRQACIGFTRVTEGHRELYGSDADGNRGVMTSFIDKDDAEDIYVEFYKEGTTDVEPPIKLEYMARSLKPLVLAEVDKYLRDNEPEEEEDGPDEDSEYDRGDMYED